MSSDLEKILHFFMKVFPFLFNNLRTFDKKSRDFPQFLAENLDLSGRRRDRGVSVI